MIRLGENSFLQKVHVLQKENFLSSHGARDRYLACTSQIENVLIERNFLQKVGVLQKMTPLCWVFEGGIVKIYGKQALGRVQNVDSESG